jgi:MAP3K TRAFs-binding domain
MPKPICFMIMPYGKKPTQAEAGRGFPTEIDFNALWDKAFAPTVVALGYDPVRADQDSGALIVTQMIERLYFADLVLADMTIPNGNVYYEVGVRQAAKEKGCVLLAADWSKPLFDVAQMRTVRYPLPEGQITDATAKTIVAAIEKEIPDKAIGVSPVHGSISGYPLNVDEAAASTTKGEMLDQSAFQGEIRAVRALPRPQRMARAKELVAKYWKPPVKALTALTLLKALKDSAESREDWNWIVGTLEKLPPDLADQDDVREQIRDLGAFAVSYGTGKHVDAAGQLEALIESTGASPERLGLLGGRYKRLYRDAVTPAEKLAYLSKSIEAYERGMELDLNQYYCSGNLPRLYRARNGKGDENRAQSVLRVVIAACERAKKLGVADEWLRATLLGAAFDAADCDKAEELGNQVAAEGAALWKIESTINDLKAAVSQVTNKKRKDKLAAILARLASTAGVPAD